MNIRFGSVCSGIEAASQAWPFWDAAWFSEIEPFPCAVLKHHYPEVPNHGDMTTLPDRILSGEVEAPDVFCGGTPCQAFSVAGNRKSLDDARGNLSLTFCEIADAIDSVRSAAGKRPAVIFWENVPGCRNTKDNFFGCFLAKLCGATEALEIENGKWPTNGLIVGERRRVAWATLDARWFGLAQRRKRVFVIAADNSLIEHFGKPCPSEILSIGSSLSWDPEKGGKAGQGIAANAQSGIVGTEIKKPHVFKIRGGCDGGGKGYLGQDEQTFTILTGNDQHLAVPVAYPINTMALGGRPNPANDARMTLGVGNDGDPQFTLQAAHCHAVATQYAVRRLTPVECERLQGFPDNYTNIPWRNKPEAPDGPRYKALGNSWAVPVVRWIGERINACL